MAKKAVALNAEEMANETPVTSADFTTPDQAAQQANPDYQIFTPEEIASVRRTRRIALYRAYAGARSGEEVIMPGTYAEDDPRLHLLAAYLVENQYGIWLD